MPIKPSENEENYIVEQELRRRLAAQNQEHQAKADAEKQRLKELHWMRCPKCGQGLFTEKYIDVEVDVCSGCKGVWLDANELETIIDCSKRSKVLGSFLKILRR